MENRGFVITSALFLTFFLSAIAVSPRTEAYAIETHGELTKAIIATYEKTNGDVFTSTQERALVEGSIAEDDALRFLNHFNDGVTGEGVLNNESSSQWVGNIIEQANWGLGKLGVHSLKSNDLLFSGKQDYTWERAVYEYVHGDQQRAAETLGHILHLVEDATVPAHVRSDLHPYKWGLGDRDEHEAFDRSLSVDDVDTDGITAIRFDSIVDALKSTASFTQKNFLSGDTLFKGYNLPNRESLDLVHADADGENQYFGQKDLVGKIVRIKQWRDKEQSGAPKQEEFFLTDAEDKILKENWSVLSRHAVASGMGVIDLFFREVEREKESGALLAMNKSRADTKRTLNALATVRDTNIKLTSLAAADVYELNKSELDGYFAAAKVYDIPIPTIARESALKEERPERQSAAALLGLESVLQKRVVGEDLPPGVPVREHVDMSALEEKVGQANALVAFLEAQMALHNKAREKECVAQSVRGPWDSFWWAGDKPGCDDPTPKIQKMFFAPIQGAGGAGVTLSGSISANPESGFFGATDITWNAEGASSCTVSGTNGDSWSGISGTRTSRHLAADATFTLTCDGEEIASVFADIDIPQSF